MIKVLLLLGFCLMIFTKFLNAQTDNKANVSENNKQKFATVDLQKPITDLLRQGKKNGQYAIHDFQNGFKAKAVFDNGKFADVIVVDVNGQLVKTESKTKSSPSKNTSKPIETKDGKLETCIVTKCFINEKNELGCLNFPCPPAGY